MQEQYALEKKKVIRGFLIAAVLATLVFGGFIVPGLINNAKYAEGPRDLNHLDPGTLKAGDYVEVQFEKMHQAFARYYMQREGNDLEVNHYLYYIYPYQEKGLIVQVLAQHSSRYDQLAYSSNNGELSVDTTIYNTGSMQKIDPEIKGHATEYMKELTGTEKPFEEEFWPYMLNLDIPKEIGEDQSSFILQILGGIYLGIILLVGLIVLGRLSVLKHKYRQY
ncbi:DUF6709 family protein [Paenibacillus sp. JJ-223]|uniref:DUF6709 family protein n=1 Tax=Paenibacillus sp. JJ-223 TaxID=2905647 RepID=UPI001F22DAF5|nr:DUF6709 family protein [Paenibacillus sp. JJ-223]CAH1219080.1 hypothetical protein PAECIP111890_04846 [Paenibacillus sp. JJ-223]